MTQPTTVNLAFVGCGDIAQSHWRGIQSHVPQFQVTAAIDLDPERAAAMAEQTGAQPFTSLEMALEQGDFDAVDIMLPHHVHEEAAIAAFGAGKHVVMEKPMATTLEACDRILAAAAKAGTVFMIAEQSQYWPVSVEIQRQINAGAIGEIISAEAYFGGPGSSKWGANDWRFRKEITGGGLCIDGGLHWIRPLRMWLGEIDEVVAALDYPLKAMEGESLAYAIMRFKTGKFATFKALRAGAVNAPSEDFRVTGTEGVLVVEKGRTGRVLLYSAEHPDGLQLLSAQEKKASAFGLELSEFAQAILHGTPMTAWPEESLRELRTALAIYRSAASRQWEKV